MENIQTAMNALVTDLWFAVHESQNEVEAIEAPSATETIITVKGVKYRVTLEVVK